MIEKKISQEDKKEFEDFIHDQERITEKYKRYGTLVSSRSIQQKI